MTTKAVCWVCLTAVQPKHSTALFSGVGSQHDWPSRLCEIPVGSHKKTSFHVENLPTAGAWALSLASLGLCVKAHRQRPQQTPSQCHSLSRDTEICRTCTCWLCETFPNVRGFPAFSGNAAHFTYSTSQAVFSTSRGLGTRLDGFHNQPY